MINKSLLTKAKNLKKVADAAYALFKRNPTVENAGRWTNASRTYSDFCVSTFNTLLVADDTSKKAEILANLEKYETCKQCGTKLIHLASTAHNSFVADSNFVEDFPGWCYNCLLSHCMVCGCSDCTIAQVQDGACSFSEVKRLSTQA